VRAATGLECTVGIGPNTLQAKLATGFGKPAGVFRLTYDSWFDVLGDLPTDTLWGIGDKTAKRLAKSGITTVKDLATADPDALAATFGPTTGPWLVRLASGHGNATVVGTPYVARSRSREVTFQHDLDDWDEVRRQLEHLARRLAGDLATEQRRAVRVVVKVRYAPFITRTHGHPLGQPTAESALIERAALEALDRFPERRPVRLLGVRAELTRP
jgi:DNA polymerase-4